MKSKGRPKLSWDQMSESQRKTRIRNERHRSNKADNTTIVAPEIIPTVVSAVSAVSLRQKISEECFLMCSRIIERFFRLKLNAYLAASIILSVIQVFMVSDYLSFFDGIRSGIGGAVLVWAIAVVLELGIPALGYLSVQPQWRLTSHAMIAILFIFLIVVQTTRMIVDKEKEVNTEAVSSQIEQSDQVIKRFDQMIYQKRTEIESIQITKREAKIALSGFIAKRNSDLDDYPLETHPTKRRAIENKHGIIILKAQALISALSEEIKDKSAEIKTLTDQRLEQILKPRPASNDWMSFAVLLPLVLAVILRFVLMALNLIFIKRYGAEYKSNA